MRRNKAGEVIGYEGIIRDITPYKQLMRKLSESEAKYRDMVENSNDGIGIYSDRGFLYVNRAFCECSDTGRTTSCETPICFRS